MAAPRKGIPAVLVPGCVDMANFWGIERCPRSTAAATCTSGTRT